MLDHRNAISIAEAQAKIEAINVLDLGTELVPVLEANGRVLAEAVSALFDYPNFRRSMYDGYAIRTEDDHDFPKNFHVMGEVQAGATYDQPLGENETVRIMTGAAVPENTGKVIMLEESQAVAGQDDQVTLTLSKKPLNIVEKGVEFKAGDHLLKQDTVLNPGDLSLISAFGLTKINVYKRPKVGIITTGTEVLTPGEPQQPGKIYNSNGALLAGLVAEAGAEIAATAQIEDDYELLSKQLAQFIKKCDLVLTTGGVSVGDFDFLATAAKASDQLLFNKLRMRPGSVTTAFIKDGTPVVALSGNPGACFTGFYLYTEPLLRRLGHQASKVQSFTGILDLPYTKTNSYDRILRGVYELKADGKYHVALIGSDQSPALGNLGLATCLFKIPGSDAPMQVPAEVQSWRLPYRS